MMRQWVLIFSVMISFSALGAKQIHAQKTLASECQLQWGEALVKKSQGICSILVRRSQEQPVLIRWALPEDGWDVSKNLKLQINISSLSSLNGVEFRVYKEIGEEPYESAPLSIFAEESFNWVPAKKDFTVTLSLGHFVKDPKKIMSPYKELGIYIHPKKKLAVKVDVKNLSYIPKPFIKKGMVSITFDDGYESLKSADLALKKNKLKATAYIIQEALGQEGYITHGEMCTLAKGNWAISSHATLPFTSIKNLESFIEKDFSEMKLKCEGKLSPEHVAYPLGQQNEVVLKVIQKYYKTARLAGSGLETLPPAHELKLRAVNVTPELKPEQIVQMAERAIENGDWLILMFHYLKPQTEPLSELDYSEEQFAQILKGLRPFADAVVTVPEAYGRYHK